MHRHRVTNRGPGKRARAGKLREKFQAWDHGAGNGLIATFHTVSVAATTGYLKILTVALKKAKPAVARGASHPVPACADPAGYWSVLLMHMNAAVASTGSASGARAALKGVPAIEKRLTAELQAFAPKDRRARRNRYPISAAHRDRAVW